MSNYMQVLKRHRENSAAAALPLAPAARRPARELEDGALVRIGVPAPSMAAPAIGALLDRLRLLAAPGGLARALVVASVHSAAASRAVIDGLAVRSRELALPVAIATLARHGGPALLTVRAAGPGATQALDLDGPGLAAALAQWLDGSAAAPLVLIETAPAMASVDGLLLGAACGGVVLVAETGITTRAALRTAAERARAAGCRVVGVVLIADGGRADARSTT
jgi:hypothetical protein